MSDKLCPVCANWAREASDALTEHHEDCPYNPETRTRGSCFPRTVTWNQEQTRYLRQRLGEQGEEAN